MQQRDGLQLRIRRVESRLEDAWFDLSARQMRKGPVNFYSVKDPVTGEWLFKVCRDAEAKKVIVKALKCPGGVRYAQLEGNSMLFQESIVEGMMYDVISITQIGEDEKISRKIPSTLEEIPAYIKENYQVKTYEEATGRQIPGKHMVTLCRSEDEEAMIKLFLLERAWPIAPPPETKPPEAFEEKPLKREIDTGQILKCPICSMEHRLIHIEAGEKQRHTLRRASMQAAGQ
ncbi:MAG: hypothetical protein RMK50_02835 [Nitrososphaerota archaeon]|nr:hypothetical protein [Candidatus Bathyarchaeota archaeon]MDW8193745.1 hypothetical protein [Nitrososphaerota archaeon]